MSCFKIALCQMNVIDDKKQNINKAKELIEIAAKNCAEIVALPEMFNCPYNKKRFLPFAEAIDTGETIYEMKELAKKLGIYIMAGSIPELCDSKLYNTSVAIDNSGQVMAVHRKMHLFDVDIPGKITFKESDIFTSGNSITVFDTEFCKMGICICYDLRFPELIRLMTLSGAKIIFAPSAFSKATGEAHWESLIRIRAIDNQVYIAATSPARDEHSRFLAHGHSMVVDPWGSITCEAQHHEELVYSNIDLTQLERIRDEFPLLKHRRCDVYDVNSSLK
jgi:predicted amidohydrolase